MNNTFKPQLLHFGIDYIRLVFPKLFTSPDFTDFFVGLSANSNYREIDWFGFHFTLDYTYSGSRKTLKFTYDGYPIIYLVEYADMGAVAQNISYSLDIYGSAFYIPELQQFFSQFWRHIGCHGKVTRLDLACDVMCTPKQFLDAGYVTQFPKGSKYGLNEKTGDCETRYFGEKKPKNKRHLIRVYDKLLDSQGKQKTKLFSHYFQFENVTRIEVEIRSTTCKSLKITPYKLGDYDFLESTFKTLAINPSGTCFNALIGFDMANVAKLKLDRKNTDVPMSSLQRSNRFLGMAINLHESNADPVGFLIDKFAKMGIYQNPIDLKKLTKATHNVETANKDNYPGFNQ